MTERHTMRLFADDAAVRHVGNGLLSRTLPREQWTHEAHLAACLWLLAERPDIMPERDLPGIIRSYNESVGGINDDTQGYHETLTQLYVAGVRVWLVRTQQVTLVERVNALLASHIADRGWPLTLYSPDTLFSAVARRELVMPDIGAWPATADPASD